MIIGPAAPPTQSCLRRRIGVGLALAVAGVGSTGTGAHADDYVVRPGDTVSHIALRRGTTVSEIVAANRLDSRATIRIGQHLALPTTTPVPMAAPAPVVHRVVAGDTVSALARRYGTTVAAITDSNGLDSRAMIRVGQTLTVPGAVPPATTSTTTRSHTVVAGDTVSALARRYGTTVAAIADSNGLDSRAMIRVGQTLAVPGATAASSGLVSSAVASSSYPRATVAAADQNRATLATARVPSTTDMRALVSATARDMGVNPALALAVSYQESGFNQAAVSPANAIGAMQVIPSSGVWASEMVGRRLDLLDPRDNAVAGVAILRRLVATSPDLPSAIASYYQGQRSVRDNGMFADTRRYVANVQALMSRFS